jgi:DNA-directed RNA polymerase III subunit RPC2
VSSLHESSKLKSNTQREALEYSEKEMRHQQLSGIVASVEERQIPNYKAREWLRSMFASHVPSTLTEFQRKAVFFALMVRWVLKSVRDPKVLDGRDFIGNKRLELAGELLDILFEDLFKSFNLHIERSAKRFVSRQRQPDAMTINTLMAHQRISEGLATAISTGNWHITRFKMKRQGVSQPLTRLSYMAFASMVTRVSSHFMQSQKIFGARALHPCQFGFICPYDTPEGAQCGLVKNFSHTAHVTVWSDPAPVRRALFNLGVEEITAFSGEEIHANVVVMLNGDPIGLLPREQVPSVLRRFRMARRRGWFHRFAAIWSFPPKDAVFVSTEGGRVCRPMTVVEDGLTRLTPDLERKVLEGGLTLERLLQDGVIEYVDANEFHDCLVAMTAEQLKGPGANEYTHVEVECGQLIGVCAAVVPFPHHNQSPRNTYQCAMGKQAIGPTALNIFTRLDKSSFFCCYPQAPMVQTRPVRLARYHELPSGQAAMVAVMSYSGHDIEDALLLNKASLDRGFHRRYALSKVDLYMKKYGDERRDRIATINDDPTFVRSQPAFSALDDDGLVRPGEVLEAGKVFANKFVPNAAGSFTEQRSRYKGRYPVYVHNVVLAQGDSGPVYGVKTRDFRTPELGDKFSSRHGQKGVCGLIVEQEDMPFTEDGVCPDIIMNPHGFPSRMTVGKMIELMSGKAGLFKGRLGNGTAFSSDRVDDITRDLVEAGFSYSGKDVLLSGITGEPMEAFIFFGPVFYQSLKHMVKDKMQARATGPTQFLTRQPTQGRSRDGGMRFGEMEKDTIVAHGAASLVYERMMLSSDAYEADICDACGYFGWSGYCQRCRSAASVRQVRIPYALKLVCQEMIAMGVQPCLRLSDL